jgi:hypothetical protein
VGVAAAGRRVGDAKYPFSRRRASGSSCADSFRRGNRRTRRELLERRHTPGYRGASPSRRPPTPEIPMNPTVSPRHPLKAIAVVLAMFVVVHGARAHVGSHEHGFSHVHIVHASPSDPDCPDIDEDDDDGPDGATFIDVIDGDAVWT